MIQKIKVTKQEIRTYESDGRIISYNFTQDFLNVLLGRDGKFEIESKSKNVTWYVRTGIQEATETDSDSETDSGSGNLETDSTVEILKSDGFDFTEKALEMANYYTVDEIRSHAKNKRVTAHTIKSIENEKSDVL